VIEKLINKIVLTRLEEMKMSYEKKLEDAKDEAEKLKISLALEIIEDTIRSVRGGK